MPAIRGSLLKIYQDPQVLPTHREGEYLDNQLKIIVGHVGEVEDKKAEGKMEAEVERETK